MTVKKTQQTLNTTLEKTEQALDGLENGLDAGRQTKDGVGTETANPVGVHPVRDLGDVNAGLPEGWIGVDLLTVCDVKTGKVDANHATPNGEYTFFTCALEPLKADTFSFEGELILLPGNGANVGHVGFYSGKVEAYQRTYVLHNHRINPKYVYLHLKSFWRKVNEEKQFGSATNYIKMGNFESYAIPLPPLAEQTVIAQTLDTLLAQVDNIKTRLDAIPKILKTFRQSVLAAAVSGKLTEAWRGENECVSISKSLSRYKEEREELKKAKKLKKSFGPKSDAGSLNFDIPDSWEWVTFEHIARHDSNALKAGPFGSALKKSDCVEKGYRVYGQEQVIAGDESLVTYHVTQDKFNQLESCSVKEGDILISLVGTIGKVLVLSDSCEKGIINPRLVKLSLQTEINREFIKSYINSTFAHDFFKGFSHGGTMEILNLGILKELPIPLPPVEEQTEIVRRVEELFAFADQIEQQVKNAQGRVNNLTQSILAKAFRGELTAQWRAEHPDLITGDNSAEALLAKIQEERDALKKKAKPKKATKKKSTAKKTARKKEADKLK